MAQLQRLQHQWAAKYMFIRPDGSVRMDHTGLHDQLFDITEHHSHRDVVGVLNSMLDHGAAAAAAATADDDDDDDGGGGTVHVTMHSRPTRWVDVPFYELSLNTAQCHTIHLCVSAAHTIDRNVTAATVSLIRAIVQARAHTSSSSSSSSSSPYRIPQIALSLYYRSVPPSILWESLRDAVLDGCVTAITVRTVAHFDAGEPSVEMEAAFIRFCSAVATVPLKTSRPLRVFDVTDITDAYASKATVAHDILIRTTLIAPTLWIAALPTRDNVRHGGVALRNDSVFAWIIHTRRHHTSSLEYTLSCRELELYATGRMALAALRDYHRHNNGLGSVRRFYAMLAQPLATGHAHSDLLPSEDDLFIHEHQCANEPRLVTDAIHEFNTRVREFVDAHKPRGAALLPLYTGVREQPYTSTDDGAGALLEFVNLPSPYDQRTYTSEHARDALAAAFMPLSLISDNLSQMRAELRGATYAFFNCAQCIDRRAQRALTVRDLPSTLLCGARRIGGGGGGGGSGSSRNSFIYVYDDSDSSAAAAAAWTAAAAAVDAVPVDTPLNRTVRLSHSLVLQYDIALGPASIVTEVSIPYFGCSGAMHVLDTVLDCMASASHAIYTQLPHPSAVLDLAVTHLRNEYIRRQPGLAATAAAAAATCRALLEACAVTLDEFPAQYAYESDAQHIRLARECEKLRVFQTNIGTRAFTFDGDAGADADADDDDRRSSGDPSRIILRSTVLRRLSHRHDAVAAAAAAAATTQTMPLLPDEGWDDVTYDAGLFTHPLYIHHSHVNNDPHGDPTLQMHRYSIADLILTSKVVEEEPECLDEIGQHDDVAFVFTHHVYMAGLDIAHNTINRMLEHTVGGTVYIYADEQYIEAHQIRWHAAKCSTVYIDTHEPRNIIDVLRTITRTMQPDDRPRVAITLFTMGNESYYTKAHTMADMWHALRDAVRAGLLLSLIVRNWNIDRQRVTHNDNRRAPIINTHGLVQFIDFCAAITEQTASIGTYYAHRRTLVRTLDVCDAAFVYGPYAMLTLLHVIYYSQTLRFAGLPTQHIAHFLIERRGQRYGLLDSVESSTTRFLNTPLTHLQNVGGGGGGGGDGDGDGDDDVMAPVNMADQIGDAYRATLNIAQMLSGYCETVSRHNDSVLGWLLHGIDLPRADSATRVPYYVRQVYTRRMRQLAQSTTGRVLLMDTHSTSYAFVSGTYPPQQYAGAVDPAPMRRIMAVLRDSARGRDVDLVHYSDWRRAMAPQFAQSVRLLRVLMVPLGASATEWLWSPSSVIVRHFSIDDIMDSQSPQLPLLRDAHARMLSMRDPHGSDDVTTPLNAAIARMTAAEFEGRNNTAIGRGMSSISATAVLNNHTNAPDDIPRGTVSVDRIWELDNRYYVVHDNAYPRATVYDEVINVGLLNALVFNSVAVPRDQRTQLMRIVNDSLSTIRQRYVAHDQLSPLEIVQLIIRGTDMVQFTPMTAVPHGTIARAAQAGLRARVDRLPPLPDTSQLIMSVFDDNWCSSRDALAPNRAAYDTLPWDALLCQGIRRSNANHQHAFNEVYGERVSDEFLPAWRGHAVVSARYGGTVGAVFPIVLSPHITLYGQIFVTTAPSTRAYTYLEVRWPGHESIDSPARALLLIATLLEALANGSYILCADAIFDLGVSMLRNSLLRTSGTVGGLVIMHLFLAACIGVLEAREITLIADTNTPPNMPRALERAAKHLRGMLAPIYMDLIEIYKPDENRQQQRQRNIRWCVGIVCAVQGGDASAARALYNGTYVAADGSDNYSSGTAYQ